MKQTIFSNWNFMRALRFGLGIAVIVQSIMLKDWTIGLLGMAFTTMPLFNIGCCGTNGCTVPQRKKDNNDI